VSRDDDALILREKGLEQHRRGELSEARALYLRALEARSTDATTHDLLGVLAQQSGRPEESLDWHRRAIALEPTPGAYANLANAFFLLSRPSEAEQACREALAMDPKFADAWQNLGNALWAQGKRGPAAQAYRTTLDLAPDRHEAERALGLVLFEEGAFGESLPPLEAANRANPSDVVVLFTLATALHHLERFEAAAERYAQTLACTPNDAKAAEHLGAALRALRRDREAAQAYERAARLDRANANAQLMLAGILVELGDYERAVPECRLATALDPHSAEARLALGLALAHTNDAHGAAKELESLLAMKPDYGKAWAPLGFALRRLGDLNGAANAYRRAAAQGPNPAAALGVLAGVLKDAGQLGAAIASAVKALRLDPKCVDALVNMGAAKIEQGRLVEGIGDLEAALRLDPSSGTAWCDLAVGMSRQGRVADAIEAYERGLALGESDHHRLGYAFALLKAGRFQEGWAAHEARLKAHPGFQTPVSAPKGPVWRGENLGGGRLIIQAEQGLGDTIQCLRFASWAALRAGRAAIQAPETLLSLCRRVDGIEMVGTDIAPAPEDRLCPIFSLPGLYGANEDRLPTTPYLHAEHALVETWRKRIGGEGAFRIGLVWQGNPNAPVERGRSVPLAELAPLFALSGVDLISLQQDYGLHQAETLPTWMRLRRLGPDFDAGDLGETAAILCSIDLLVTCDTALAHLAGALHRPAWLLLNAVSDWRWMQDRADSPWYPSMRLYRQDVPGRWAEPIDRMAKDLARLIANQRVSRTEKRRRR